MMALKGLAIRDTVKRTLHYMAKQQAATPHPPSRMDSDVSTLSPDLRLAYSQQV